MQKKKRDNDASYAETNEASYEHCAFCFDTIITRLFQKDRNGQ